MTYHIIWCSCPSQTIDHIDYYLKVKTLCLTLMLHTQMFLTTSWWLATKFIYRHLCGLIVGLDFNLSSVIPFKDGISICLSWKFSVLPCFLWTLCLAIFWFKEQSTQKRKCGLYPLSRECSSVCSSFYLNFYDCASSPSLPFLSAFLLTFSSAA